MEKINRPLKTTSNARADFKLVTYDTKRIVGNNM